MITNEALLPDIIWTACNWLLHGNQAEDLQQVVLHHITNYPELIKISTTTLGTEGFLEGDCDIGNIGPSGAVQTVSDSRRPLF